MTATTTVMVVEMLPRYPCSIKSTQHRNSSLLLQCDFKSISRSLSHSLSEVGDLTAISQRGELRFRRWRSWVSAKSLKPTQLLRFFPADARGPGFRVFQATD